VLDTKSPKYLEMAQGHISLSPYPQGTRIPEFAKFSGDQGKSTREHIGQFLAQLGELADTEHSACVYFHYP
jgi:hypothetical protein